MSRSDAGAQHTRSRWAALTSFIAVTVVAGLLNGCRPARTGDTSTLIAPPPLLNAEQLAAMDVYGDFAHGLNLTIRTACENLDWETCYIPEVTDDQALMDQKDSFGPHAWVTPSDDINTWDEQSDFDAASGRLVGFVYVNPGTLPQTYLDLNLSNGVTCFYLVRQGGQMTGRTYASATSCPASIPTGAGTLRVETIIAPGPFQGAHRIPGVARFHEVEKGQSRGNPGVGFKCGDRWCIFLPDNEPGEQNSRSIAPAHRNDYNLKTWQVYGWSDVQTLALPPQSSPGGMVRSPLQASIVTHESLAHYNAGNWPTNVFVHVATIRIWRPAVGKYLSDWKLANGFNEIWMRKTGSGTFEAELRRWSGSNLFFIRKLNVERRGHNGTFPPSVARFLWSPGDENVWVACDDGCCKVTTDIF